MQKFIPCGFIFFLTHGPLVGKNHIEFMALENFISMGGQALQLKEDEEMKAVKKDYHVTIPRMKGN